MKLSVVFLMIVFCVCSTGSERIRRQSDWSWGNVDTGSRRSQNGNRPQNGNSPPLIRPPIRPTLAPVENNALPEGAVATPPPTRIADCLTNCRTTPEYNPVCGNDGNTYHNRERLNCQRMCTQTNIQFLRLGTCAAL